MEIIDEDMSEYPEDEVLRFIKVALFCTQAISKQRPSMKQVLIMLSKDVHLNEMSLTEPGIYRTDTRRSSRSSLRLSSSMSGKGNPSPTNPFFQPSYSGVSQIVSELIPR